MRDVRVLNLEYERTSEPSALLLFWEIVSAFGEAGPMIDL